MESLATSHLGRIGYWNAATGHVYKRRNVEMIETFVGWKKITQLIEDAVKIGNERDDHNGPRDGAMCASLFASGGRVSEVVRSPHAGLKKENVQVKKDEGLIVFVNQKMVKKYKKVEAYIDEDGKSRWKTQRLEFYRTTPAPLDEPTSKYVIDYLETIREDEFLFPISRIRAYQIVMTIDPKIWVHWWRSQRASQLAVEYGWELSDILKFFQWRKLETADRYARLGYKGLARKFPSEVARVW